VREAERRRVLLVEVKLRLVGAIRVLLGAVVEIAIVESPQGETGAELVEPAEPGPFLEVGLELHLELGIEEVPLRDELTDALARVRLDLGALGGHRGLRVGTETEAHVAVLVEIERPGDGTGSGEYRHRRRDHCDRRKPRDHGSLPTDSTLFMRVHAVAPHFRMNE
jgi:hypothetical protein